MIVTLVLSRPQTVFRFIILFKARASLHWSSSTAGAVTGTLGQPGFCICKESASRDYRPTRSWRVWPGPEELVNRKFCRRRSIRVITKLKLKRVILVGSSMGDRSCWRRLGECRSAWSQLFRFDVLHNVEYKVPQEQLDAVFKQLRQTTKRHDGFLESNALLSQHAAAVKTRNYLRSNLASTRACDCNS